MPPRRINEIVLEKRAITADTALRLARFFGTSEAFWMSLQADYDLERTRREIGGKLEHEIRPFAAHSQRTPGAHHQQRRTWSGR